MSHTDADGLRSDQAGTRRSGTARGRYAVFGAAALNLHGLARFTEALDLFIAPDRDNIDRRKRALHYLMKRDTVRLKDRADAEMLRQRFDVGEPD